MNDECPFGFFSLTFLIILGVIVGAAKQCLL